MIADASPIQKPTHITKCHLIYGLQIAVWVPVMSCIGHSERAVYDAHSDARWRRRREMMRTRVRPLTTYCLMFPQASNARKSVDSDRSDDDQRGGVHPPLAGWTQFF
jgi:hypothetical protein